MSTVSATAAAAVPTPWRAPLAALLVLAAVLVGLYWDTLSSMVGIWERSGTFAHCYLVAPISLWLVWRQWGSLKHLVPRPQAWALLPMAGVAFTWLVGDMAGVNALTQFAFTAQLVLAVILVLGTQVARRIAFPLAYLFFMVPFGEFMLPLLMQWTADFTVAAIRLTGIPVYREGLQFVIPSGNWSVVEACSGVRYLIASFMVGSLFAYLNYNSLKRRLLFCGVSLAVPLVANWLRAYMIVMLGHFSGNQLAVGVDHLIYGWVFFGLVVGLMFYIGARWSEAPAPEPAAAEQNPPPVVHKRRMAAAACAGALVLLVPVGMNGLMNQQAAAAAVAAPLVLPPLPGTTDAAPATPLFTPPLQNPSATAWRGYRFDGATVYVHLGYYQRQTYGRKLVTSANALAEGEDKKWQLVASGSVSVAAGAEATRWRSATLLGGAVSTSAQLRDRVEVRQTYWAGGRFTDSGARATLYTVMGKLAGQGDGAAMVTVTTEEPDAARAAARLQAFLGAHAGALERQLITYRSQR